METGEGARREHGFRIAGGHTRPWFLSRNIQHRRDRDTVDTLKDTLRIFADMIGGVTTQPEAMEKAALRGYATATDLADYLVNKGLPFRDAHEVVAHAVVLEPLLVRCHSVASTPADPFHENNP